MWPQLAQMNPQQLQQLMLQHFMQQQGAGAGSPTGMPAGANPLMQGGQGAMNPQLMALLPYLMRQQSAGAGQGAPGQQQMNPQLMQMLMQHYMGGQGQGVPVQ